MFFLHQNRSGLPFANSLKISPLLFLLFILCNSNSILAQDFSFSARELKNLSDAANEYRHSQGKRKINLQLPEHLERNSINVIPFELRSKDYFQTENLGRQVDNSLKITFFKSETESSSDFNRIVLVEEKDGKSYLTGYVRRGEKIFSLEPHSQNTSSAKYQLLEANEEEILAACGLRDLHDENLLIRSQSKADDSFKTQENTIRVVDIATDADYEYYQQFGSSNAVYTRILSVLSGASAIFESHFNVRMSVVHQNVWTIQSDPYTSSNSGTLISQFRSYWEANRSSVIDYDIAHMFTGKDMDGSTVGIAYLDSVCSSARYGVSQLLSSLGTEVILAAHEIGHNFSADHDSCSGNDSWIMCPYLVSQAESFSTSSVNQVNSALGRYSCLYSSSPPNSAPTLSQIPNLSTHEGSSVSTSIVASDPDGDAVTLFLVNPPSGATLSGTTLRYAADFNTVSSAQGQRTIAITYGARDSNGAETSLSVNVLVSNVNRTPSGPTSLNMNGRVGEWLTLSLAVTDPDGDPVTYSASGSLPTGLQVSFNTGQITWLPSQGQEGSYSVQVMARDVLNAELVIAVNITIAALPTPTPTPTPNPTPTAIPSPTPFPTATPPPSATPQPTVTPGPTATPFPTVTPLPSATPISSVTPTPNPTFTPPSVSRKKVADFSGSGRSSLSVFRGQSGMWYDGDSDRLLQKSYTQIQLGLTGDIPVTGDYDGDGKIDRGVFREPGAWFILLSSTNTVSTFNFGLAGDIPVPGHDYDGDLVDDTAVYRAGKFIYHSSATSRDVYTSIGGEGFIPVPCDYDGDNKANIAVYELLTGMWHIQNSKGQLSENQFGLPGDYPMPGYYKNPTVCNIAVWRPENGSWYFQGEDIQQWGLPGDLPIFGDFNGDGIDDPAVWRPGSALFYINYGTHTETSQLGLPDDKITTVEWLHNAMRKSHASKAAAGNIGGADMISHNPLDQSVRFQGASFGSVVKTGDTRQSYLLKGDFNGDSKTDHAVFKNGEWNIFLRGKNSYSYSFGLPGDLPVSGDFDGDGKTDIGVYRPFDTGNFSRWYIVKSSDSSLLSSSWGMSGDIPLPMDINGDGRDELVVLRPGTMVWYAQDASTKSLMSSQQWGLAGDTPCLGDFDRDGYADLCVNRRNSNTFFIKLTGGGSYIQQWGLDSDIPFSFGPDKVAVYRENEGAVYWIRPKSQELEKTVIGRRGNALHFLHTSASYVP